MNVKSLIDDCLETAKLRLFCESYNKTFIIVHANTPTLKRRGYKIRYDVYCTENGWVDAIDKQISYDEDSFDCHSSHSLLIYKPSGKVMGTVRVVEPQSENLLQSFPLQKVCDHPYLQQEDKVSNICEISKLCISSGFRRRKKDGNILPAYYNADESIKDNVTFKRSVPYAPLGLIHAAFDAALQKSFLNCICCADSCMLEAFKALAIKYRVLGPRINYLGAQQPIIFNIKNALDNMIISNKACWAIVSDQGRLHSLANQLYQNEWDDNVFGYDCYEKIFEKLSPLERLS